MTALAIHRNAAVRAPARRGARSGPVVTTRVHPAVWREARRLAGGDASRLQILGSGAVLVTNGRRP